MSDHRSLIIIGVCFIAFIGGYGLVSMIVDIARKRAGGSSNRPTIHPQNQNPQTPPSTSAPNPSDSSRPPWATPASEDRRRPGS